MDGITYGKGAVFLNQIINSIGETCFFNGCKAYFKKFPWQNTELKDFMQCLNEAVQGQDLLEFSDIWLKNSGCNKIDSEFVYNDTGVEKIVIR